jgi:anti-anti-sigma factor
MRDRLSQIEFEERDAALIGWLNGEVDGSNANELGRALLERLPTSAHGMVLEMSGVNYLDSAGVELIFQLARRLRDRRQRLRLIVPDGSPLRRVLAICDVSTVAPLDESLEDSLDGLAWPPT